MATSNDNDRYVTEHEDGWAVVKQLHERASAVFPTQEEAIDRAREIIRNAGGGELVVRGRDGKIRQKDTVAPGQRDPLTPPTAPAEALATAPEAPATAPEAPATAPEAPATAPEAPEAPAPEALATAPEGAASTAPEGKWAGFVRKLRGR